MGSPGVVPLRLLPLLLALLDPGSTEDVKVVNALVGKTIDLPLYYSGNATGYTWTKENNRVAEWDEGLSVTYYDTLKGRCELNTSTGVLTIRDLKEEDSARYKGEALVNNVYIPSNFHLHVFPSLNNPTVTCNNTGGIYTILCDHRPEPNTAYMWRSKDGLVIRTDANYSLSNFNKNLTLKNNKVPFQSLECVVQNPASEKSAPVPEDCFRGKTPRGRNWLFAALTLDSLFVGILGVVVRHGTGNDQPQGDNADNRPKKTEMSKEDESQVKSASDPKEETSKDRGELE